MQNDKKMMTPEECIDAGGACMIHAYGCHNKPTVDGYWANDGLLIHEDGNGSRITCYKQVWVPNVMTRGCKYDRRHEDWSCRGCECE